MGSAALSTDSRPSRRWWPAAVAAVALLAAVVVVLAVLAGTGQLAPASATLSDPGAAVRYGLPVARVVHDLAAAVTVGFLVLTAWCTAPTSRTERDALTGVRAAMVRAGLAAIAAWWVAGFVVLVLSAADVSGYRLTDPGFAGVAMSFAGQVEAGQAMTASWLGVAVAGCVLLAGSRITTVAWAAVLSVVALLPLALAGHASGARDHVNSVDTLAFHLVAVCIWVGGLAALLLTARRLGDQLPTVVARYSRIAGWCFAVVAGSGVVNAVLRLPSLAALASTYGVLVIGKVVALTLLGLGGLAHRRATIGRLRTSPRVFVRLAVVELAVMGAAMGLAVALSRSAPPAPTTEPDRLSELLGQPAPPPLTVGRYFGTFYPETLWLGAGLVAAALYLAGIVRLRRRGDRWPVQRTVFWLVGCAALVFVTNGGPAVYGRLQFSIHMIQHMSLMVLVPLLLVFGAPVTLAMRALTARTDGSLGARETLLRLVHSRVLSVLGHPVVAAVLFTGSLTVFYYSPLFPLAMSTHTGHVLMTAHFLASGYLYVWALVGLDPGPARPSYPFRLLLLLVTLAFHAFFGIALMSSTQLLAADWWHALGHGDDAALLADQQEGGAIAWAAADIPSLLLAVALVAGWVRSDARETRRLDRQADRDDDAELHRYNEQLAALARRDRR